MIIKFEDEDKEEITEQQAHSLEEYSKVYYQNGVFKKREMFENNQLAHLDYRKEINQTNAEVISFLLPLNIYFTIFQTEIFWTNYELRRHYHYNNHGILFSKSHTMHDADNNLIAVQVIDLDTDLPDYEQTEKSYYDKSLLEDDYLFTCHYNADGSVDEIDYTGLHTCSDGHDSEIFYNEPEHIQTLMELTGITQELMNYYLSPNAIPEIF